MADEKTEQSFVDVLQDLNKGPAKNQDMPPLHPRPDQLVDISQEEAQEKVTRQLLQAKKFRSNYRVFDLAEDEQREDLEEIMNHILCDGWILGFEEKQILQSGRVIVFIKYLIPNEPVTKPPAPDDIADRRTK